LRNRENVVRTVWASRRIDLSPDQKATQCCPTRQRRSPSLSFIAWRRGGTFVCTTFDCPSPRSSPHSFVTGRRRKSLSPNFCHTCANLHDCRPEEADRNGFEAFALFTSCPRSALDLLTHRFCN
jgi:hypothetical protein